MSTSDPITLVSASLVPVPPTLYLGLSDGATVIVSLKEGLTLRETALALNEATLELMHRHREEQAARTEPLPLGPDLQSEEKP